VTGEKIHYGFWSKNSYPVHTWEEMFEWKFKRKPTTQEDFDLLTEENVTQWFTERHTTKNLISGKEKPKNIKTQVTPRAESCTNYYFGSHLVFTGKIIFSDGSQCELELIEESLGIGSCPVTLPMRIKPPCNKCF